MGIAEGGVHLARIALHKGDEKRSKQLAEEALAASLECNCSPFNTARAHLAVAEVYSELAKRDSGLREEALKKVLEARQFAKEKSNTTVEARAKILHSRLLPIENFDERYELTSAAFQVLSDLENHQRGTAETELG